MARPQAHNKRMLYCIGSNAVICCLTQQPSLSCALQYDLFQYLLNVADDDCEKLLFCLTFLHENEIQKVLRAHFTAPEKRIAQQVLAEYLVHLLRGYEGMREAQTVSLLLLKHTVQLLDDDL